MYDSISGEFKYYFNERVPLLFHGTGDIFASSFFGAVVNGLDMYEAAKVDGASRWKQIWTITLPSIAPTITIMFILAVGGLLNTNFDQILVLNNPLNAPRSNVLDIYVYQTAMRGMRYSYASAIGLFKSVIAFILLFITNKITTKLNDTALF